MREIALASSEEELLFAECSIGRKRSPVPRSPVCRACGRRGVGGWGPPEDAALVLTTNADRGLAVNPWSSSPALARWRRRLTSVEAAALSGVLFAAFYLASLLLGRQGVVGFDEAPSEVAARIAAAEGRDEMLAGYVLASFAAIAFIWFVAVLRRRIPADERFVTTVFVAGSTIFIALYLAAMSVVAGPHYVESQEDVSFLQPETLMSLQSVTYGLLFVVAPRIQVLVIISATAIGRRHEVFPGWLVLVSYLIAAIQLVNFTLFEPLLLLFPLWVATVGLVLMRGRARLEPRRSGTAG